MKPTEIRRKIQVLVEGNDQRNFFEGFVTHLSIPDVQIQNFGGVNELRGFLSALVAITPSRAVRSIGIVRDAEDSVMSAFDSVCSSLRHAGLSAPRRAGERSGGHPAATVLILPDNEQPGMIETLLCRTFANTAEDRCIDACFECVEKASAAPVNRPDKARAHAWLATRPDPHVSVGVAAKKGYRDFDHAAFAGIRTFLTGL